MASGVAVTDDVKTTYDKMKLNKKSDVAGERIRLVQLKMNKEMTLIEVKEVVEEKHLEEKGNVFKYVQSLMQADCCSYFLYDCHYKVEDTPKKEDLIFIMWVGYKAPIKEKMLYSSSKSAITKIINVKHILELTDDDEKGLDGFIAKMGKNITEMEGVAVK